MHKRPFVTLPGFFSWDAMDEQMEREGAALKKSFHSTAVRGTSRRRAHVAGGPKNREKRKDLVRDAD